MLLAKRPARGKPRSPERVVRLPPATVACAPRNGLPLADLPMPRAALFHRETTMFQILSNNRRPSRGIVLACVAVTVLYWVGLCLVAGRPIWFW